MKRKQLFAGWHSCGAASIIHKRIQSTGFIKPTDLTVNTRSINEPDIILLCIYKKDKKKIKPKTQQRLDLV